MSYMNSNLSPLEQIEYNSELKDLSFQYPQILEWAEAYEELDEIQRCKKEEDGNESAAKLEEVFAFLQNTRKDLTKTSKPFSKKYVFDLLSKIQDLL